MEVTDHVAMFLLLRSEPMLAAASFPVCDRLCFLFVFVFVCSGLVLSISFLFFFCLVVSICILPGVYIYLSIFLVSIVFLTSSLVLFITIFLFHSRNLSGLAALFTLYFSHPVRWHAIALSDLSLPHLGCKDVIFLTRSL